MKRIARRSFLSKLGAGLALLPFVPWLDSEADATPDQMAKRFIVFCTPTGMTGRYPDNFAPSGSETDFTLSPILKPLGGGYSVNELEIGNLVPNVVITQGIELQAAYDSPLVGGHSRGLGVLLTATPIAKGNLLSSMGSESSGWAGGISIDQAIANVVGKSTPFSSVELGVDNFGGVQGLNYVISYKGAAEPLPVQSNPYKAFDRLFGGLVGMDPAELAIRKKRRQSVIDDVRGQLEVLNDRIGSADRHKIAAHLDGIRSIENRLVAGAGADCSPPKLAVGVDGKSDGAFASVGQMQMDLLVAALQCDLTRVGSIMWGPGRYDNRFTFLPQMKGAEGLHSLSHHSKSDAVAQDQLEAVARFYTRQFAYLAQKLKSIPEGNGTMLDNTVVLWCSEVSNPNNHSHRNMPFVLAGSGGGNIKTGRFLRYDDEPHNKLFVSICHAMGMTNSTFGDEKYGSGPLTGLG